MSDCCSEKENEKFSDEYCPKCNLIGKSLKLITIKSMLKPYALEKLNPEWPHYYCSNSDCVVVYFDGESNTYYQNDIKVPVFSKNKEMNTPVCYCFGWTKEKLKESVNNEQISPIDQIQEHIKNKRCGCDVNNPHGNCCLGDVTTYLKTLS